MKMIYSSRKNSLVLASLCLALLGLTGCAWSIGGQKEAGTVVREPTKGQELIDLKRALDQEAITREEYDRQKEALLDR